METRTVEEVEGWNTRSFADGFAGLRELSDGEFSGAVRAGGAWLFMLNGRIIGVYEGTLDDFEDADGTAYAAPHPSLPLLFSMREKGGDTRAKYYTNDTPLSEVDSTLSQGSFTGYVELSENVLSGDYYVAYYGGRSMSVAFVGASEQVVTGDEAFERAEDEVGIYEVRDVDIEVTDVPEPEGSDDSHEPDAAGATPSGTPGSPSSGAAGEPSAGTTDESSSGASAGATDSPAADAGRTDASGEASDGPGGQPSQPSGQSPSGGSAGESSPGESAEASSPGESARKQSTASEKSTPSERSDASASDPGETASATAGSQAAATGESDQGRSATDAIQEAEADDGVTTAEETAATAEGATAEETTATPEGANTAEETADATERTGSSDADGGDASGDENDAFSEEKKWREATTIPSLDPDRSEGPEDGKSRQKAGATGTSAGGSASGGTASKGTTSKGTPSAGKSTGRSASSESKKGRAASASATSSKSQAGSKSQTSDGASAESQSRGEAASGSGAASGSASDSSESASSGASDELQAKVQKLRSQLKQRKQQVQQLKERLSTVESERDEYERERDALRQEVQRLEARLENLDSAGSGGGGRQLARAQAFDGTNLFVRYRSKGEATLEEAAKGEADPEDVNANLQLEHHTQFEASDVSVEGQAFEEFLTDSFEYRFVSWVIENLLYEIRDTGHRNSLRDLYESIPKIDRVDLNGSVSAGTDEEDTRKESFDVIMRDRMGNPLLVADLNDSRDPTTGDMMGSLVESASGVGEAHEELSGAFQVTESFFEPEALETTETATSGGFLSREKRESFVKLSRKRGYHLCLVESRSGGFHLNVPEL